MERKPTQVRAFMHGHGFKYRKLASIPCKVDTEKQRQFLEDELNPVIDKAKDMLTKLLSLNFQLFEDMSKSQNQAA